MGEQLHFVSYDPTTIRKTNGIDLQVECQQCHERFNTAQELRNHIGHYLLEIQQLHVRAMEAHMHLPSRPSLNEPDINGNNKETGNFSGDVNDDNNNGNDDDCDCDGDGDDGDEEEGDEENQSALGCPYPKCTKKFKGEGLLRHYQRHIQCYEICVYCHEPFRDVRVFLRHACNTREQLKSSAREFYRNERRAQLRKHVIEELTQMRNKRKIHQQTKRRLHEAVGPCSTSTQASKRHQAIHGTNTCPQVQSGAGDMLVAGVVSEGDERIPVQPTPTHSFPYPSDTSALPDNNSFSASIFTSAALPLQAVERSHHTAQERLWAPLFKDITVTPYHNAQHLSPYPLPRNTLDGVYPVASQHTLAGIEPSHALHNDGEYGQTNGWNMGNTLIMSSPNSSPHISGLP